MHTPGSRHRVRAHARRRAPRTALTSALPARAQWLSPARRQARSPRWLSAAHRRPRCRVWPTRRLQRHTVQTGHAPANGHVSPHFPHAEPGPPFGGPGARPMFPSTLPAAHAGLWRGLPPRLRVLEAAAIDSATIGGPRLRPSPPSHTGLDSHTIRSAAGRRMVSRAPPSPIPATVRP